jgi:hypothetical protein
VETLEQPYIFTKSGICPSLYPSVSIKRKSKVIFVAFGGAIIAAYPSLAPYLPVEEYLDILPIPQVKVQDG